MPSKFTYSPMNEFLCSSLSLLNQITFSSLYFRCYSELVLLSFLMDGGKLMREMREKEEAVCHIWLLKGPI